MDFGIFKKRLGSGARNGKVGFSLPRLVMEVEPNFVMAACIKSRRHVVRTEVQELEVSCLEPSPDESSVIQQELLRSAIEAVISQVGKSGSRFALLLPDTVFRVAILRFETLPDHRREAETLVRWRLKESLPYNAEEARLDYQFLRRDQDGIELMAVCARNSLLLEYEAALEPVGGTPSVILPATAALLPLLPEGGEDEAQLLLHICSGWMTSVVVVGNVLLAWRNRDLARVTQAGFAEEIAREVARIVASCQDRLKVKIGRLWICERPEGTNDLLAEFGNSVGVEIEPLLPGPEFADTVPAGERMLFESYGATVVGLLSNSR